MNLLNLPSEILSMIIDEIMPTAPHEQETRRSMMGSRELIWAYDDLRNLRLCCQSLASVPNRYLLHTIYFSLDPETWARAFRISKQPSLAAHVRRIVYTPAVYDEDLPTLEAYSAFMIDQETRFQGDRQNKGLDPLTYPSWDPETSFWQEAEKRGYHRYRMKIGFQHWILQCSGVGRAPDKKMLTRIMTRLPNLDRFAIVTDAWPVSGMRYNFGPASRNLSSRSTHWVIRQTGRKSQSTVDLLPQDCLAPAVAEYRSMLTIRFHSDLHKNKRLELTDRLPRLKIRAIKLFQEAALATTHQIRSLFLNMERRDSHWTSGLIYTSVDPSPKSDRS